MIAIQTNGNASTIANGTTIPYAEEPLPRWVLAHVTSARRAKTSIRIATNASTGSMKSAIAAPSPVLPELMPVWNA